MPKKKPAKRKRVPFSDEKLYRYLQRELRRTFRNSPLKAEAWKNGIVPGKRGVYYCYVCAGTFKRSDKMLTIDHIQPVVLPEFQKDFGYMGRMRFFDRMFCPLENLSPICKKCHKAKTKREGEERRAWKAGS